MSLALAAPRLSTPTFSHSPLPLRRDAGGVRLWLLVCVLLVAAMVALGGYTRLSGSGLSITAWKPLHGSIPPLSDADWQEEFDAYKQSPQYQQVNTAIDMDGFKTIFWPEFLHRLLGRVIGLAFFAPFVVFLARRSMNGRTALRFAAILALGGFQGVVGWLMVKSGLMDIPRVSHLRLAAHLTLAFTIFACLLWAFLDVKPLPRPAQVSRLQVRAVQCFTTLLMVQIIWGAFMAGLHAGYVYNTWPDFNGEALPPDLASGSGALLDSFTHIPAVQLIHRSLGAILLASAFGLWAMLRVPLRHTPAALFLNLLLICINALFALGVLTLLNVVPLGLAWAHQMVALCLFALCLALLHSLPRPHETAKRD